MGDAGYLSVRALTRAMTRKIGLLNHMGGGNLGDDATQDAVMQNLKRRWPGSVVLGFSMNPSDTETRHGIPSYPIRIETWSRHEGPTDSTGQAAQNPELTLKARLKSALGRYPRLFEFLKKARARAAGGPLKLFQELSLLARSFQIIRTLDVLVISGGGQLLDAWGGPWKFPYTVFKWTLLARLACVRCYFLNVGAGPLDHRLGRWFIKRALQLADYVSFRDENSKTLVTEIGFKGASHVFADCVYSLDLPAPHPNGAPSVREPVVGLSPMAYCDPRVYWQKDPAVYEGFIHTLASFGSWLTQNNYRLALFSTDIFFDAQTIAELEAALRDGSGCTQPGRIERARIAEVEELLAHMNSLDYVVTCRYHGVVFAHLLNKPVLALSHHPKVSTLMSDLGLAKYCLDIRKCDIDLLQETFLSLVASRDQVRSCMADKLAGYRRDLSVQFDQLFPQEARA